MTTRAVPGQGVVQLLVAGIDEQRAAAERRELRLRCDDEHVLDADALDHPRRKLLVSAPEDESLPPDRRHDDECVVAAHELEQRALVGVGGHEPTSLHRVDAEQGLLQAESAHDRPRRRARPDQAEAAVGDPIGDGAGDRLLRVELSVAASRLPALDASRLRRDAEVAVEPGGHASCSERLLVDVHHLGGSISPARAVHEARRHVGGRPRGDGEDGRVHLHPGGNAEHRHAVGDRGEHVDGGSVAAGEEKQVDAARRELRGDPPRVGGGRDLVDGSDDDRLESVRASLARSHLARGREELHVTAGGRQRPEGLACPKRRHRLGPLLERSPDKLRIVASLQRRAAAEARDRIDDEAQTRGHLGLIIAYRCLSAGVRDEPVRDARSVVARYVLQRAAGGSRVANEHRLVHHDGR